MRGREPFRRLIADLKKRLDALSFHAVPPLYFDPTTNTLAYDDDVLGGYFRITGPAVGSAYPSIRIRAVPGGGWVDGTDTPTLHELNGVGTVGLIRVYARKTQAGLWTFQLQPCPLT